MLSRVEKYGPLNSHDLVKVIALIIMTIDHVGAYLAPDEMWWRAVGRITFPVWFFLIGYARSRKINEEILWGALILIVSNHVNFYSVFPFNALISIIVCRWMLTLDDKWRMAERWPIETLIVLFFLNVVFFIFWEYGMIAVMFAFGGKMVRLNLKGWKYAAFWIGSTASFIFWMLHIFDFNAPQIFFMVFGTGCVCMALYNYQQRELGWTLPGPVDWVSKLVSRYSLQYYWIHRVLFQIIGAWILMNHPHVRHLFSD